jgi:N-acetyl-gamma-glutamyl-phosphate reductase
VLVGRLDNLGKGASGNAVQCLNLMIGAEETAGLSDGVADSLVESR